MPRISYIGIKEDGAPFRVVSSKLFKQEFGALPKGRYRITVDKLRNSKSQPQLGYYYACVLPLSWKALTEAGWEFESEEEVEAFWKDKFAEKEIVNRNTGEVMTIPALKRDMTTTEMMTYVDSIRNYCAEYLGAVIPDPETQINLFRDDTFEDPLPGPSKGRGGRATHRARRIPR